MQPPQHKVDEQAVNPSQHPQTDGSCTCSEKHNLSSPSGEKHSLLTVCLWPFSSRTHAPEDAFHTTTAGLLPASPAATCVPQQDHARHCSVWLLVVDRSSCTCWSALASLMTTKLPAAVATRLSAVGQAAATALLGADSPYTPCSCSLGTCCSSSSSRWDTQCRSGNSFDVGLCGGCCCCSGWM